MKLIFLNVLDAEIAEPLREFLQKHSGTTDIFCFQEAGSNAQALIKEVLPGFAQVAAGKPSSQGQYVFDNITLARSGLTIESSSSNESVHDLGLALYTSVHCGGKLVHIANVHGLSRPGKLDTPERLRQSQEILNAVEAAEGIKIVGGDFNVLPETQSVRIFEDAGYRNLITDYGIKTTRNHVSLDKYPGNELYYSDYVFTKGAEVASFEVPPEIVSDHQPLIVVIDLE